MASPLHDEVTGNRIYPDGGDSDDSDSWIPLEKQDNEERVPPASSVEMGSSHSSRRALNNRNNAATRSCPARMTSVDLNAIQRRLENRKTLKESLVDHPIQRFYMSFLGYLCRELLWSCWTVPSIQTVGIVLLVAGSFLGISRSLWSFWWFILRPRPTFCLAGILIISCLSLMKFDNRKITQHLNDAFTKLVASVQKTISFLDPLQMLRWSLVFLLLLPTLLEARIMAFLVSLPLSCSGVEILLVGTATSVSMLYRYRVQKVTPRDATMSGMLALYGCTWMVLLMAACQSDSRMIGLNGVPLLFWMIATGSLLLMLSSQWKRDYRIVEYAPWLSSRAIRQALRLSLQDVLATLGETVQQDEMLQLVMIRWIIDYWSYTPPPPASTSSSGVTDNTSSGGSTTTTSSTAAFATTPTNTSPAQQPHHDLQWVELLPMLNMTTDQMANEINPTTNPSIAQGSQQPERRQNGSSPLDNLKDMLIGMDMDETAKPAVLAYKNAIDAFPPSRQQAEAIAVVCRCPSALTLLWLLFAFGREFSIDGLLSLVFLLCPFMLMEGIRVQEWARRSTQSDNATGKVTHDDPGSTGPRKNADDNPFSLLPPHMDAMHIILSKDKENTVNDASALIQVWDNICDSVGALETGLTAARCVQTTVVATEFAGNIMSLAQFGMEISQHGWMFGLTTMAKELFMLHYNQQVNSQQQARGNSDETRYTHAAIHAVQNGRVMMRNAGVLMEEQPEAPRVVLEAVTGFLAVVIGRGWLWDKEEEHEHPIALEIDPSIDKIDPDKEEVGEEVVVKTETISSAEEPRPGQPTGSESQGMDSPSMLLADDEEDEITTIVPEVAHIALHIPSAATCGESPEQAEDDELTGVIERVADAYERDLVTKDEKDTFMEMLTKGEVHVVKSSLNCLFQEAEIQLELQTSKEAPQLDASASRPHDAMMCNPDPSYEEVEECEWKNLSYSRDSLDVANESTSTHPHSSSAEKTESVHCESFMAALAAKSSANSQLEQRQSHPGLQEGSKDKHDDEDPVPHWVKVAAGVGLGVFGGVAIVNSAKGKENIERKESASPMIEELPPFDESESMDEWESLPRQE